MEFHTCVHGFEDYRLFYINREIFFYNEQVYCSKCFDRYNGEYITCDNLPVNVNYDSYNYCVNFEHSLIRDNKELLSTAKKVFVHPSCKLSRSLMAEKYKKCLNPWLSDVVVVSQPDYSGLGLHNVALFLDEIDKIIFRVDFLESDADFVSKFEIGKKFKDYKLGTLEPISKPYNSENVYDAELIYVGKLLYVPSEKSWVIDILTRNLPANKIVFERTIQESLGNETNKLDFDSLCSIKDMLESSDNDTVSAGLKSLSMMDWIHYSQSVKYILGNVDNKFNWIYNKACNSTSVKYMIKTIAGNVRSRNYWPGYYDNQIYKEDFELFKKLICHYDNVQPDQIMTHLVNYAFVCENADGFLTPNIKPIN